MTDRPTRDRALARLVDRRPADRPAPDRRLPGAAAAVRRRAPSSRTAPTPTTRRRRRPSRRSDGVRRGREPHRPACSAAPRRRRRPSPASTSTAASASARPTCSPRSGTWRRAASTSAPSSSTRRWSARSATREAVNLLSRRHADLHRRVRARRPRRHDDDVPAARRARRIRHPHRAPPATPRRTRSARAGSPRSDFLREIQALSDRFETIRIDGLDYRRRDTRRAGRHLVAGRRARSPRARRRGSRSTTSTTLIATSRPCTPRATSSCSTGVDGSGCRDVRPLHGPDGGAALRRVHRPRLRRPDPDRRRPACR